MNDYQRLRRRVMEVASELQTRAMDKDYEIEARRTVFAQVAGHILRVLGEVDEARKQEAASREVAD